MNFTHIPIAGCFSPSMRETNIVVPLMLVVLVVLVLVALVIRV